jgi:hypothetical protein
LEGEDELRGPPVVRGDTPEQLTEMVERSLVAETGRGPS